MEENYALGKNENDRKSQIYNMLKHVASGNVEVLDAGSRHSQPKYDVNVQ